MSDGPKNPARPTGSFFKHEVAGGKPSGPRTSEEWWDYLCAQADSRHQKGGDPRRDALIDWRHQVVLPEEEGRPKITIMRRRRDP